MEPINHTSTFNKLIQSLDHQCLPWVASISTIMGVAIPFFQSFQNAFSPEIIPSFLFNRASYFVIAGTAFTITIISRLLRTHHIDSVDQTEDLRTHKRTYRIDSIDQKEDLKIANILRQSHYSETLRNQLAEKIAANPGNYSPLILVQAGVYFIEKKNYEKAAVLCAGGICRCAIDVKISGDVTTGGTPVVAAIMMVNPAVDKLKGFELEAWKKARNAAYRNFIEWDRKTPRHYDDKWIHPYGLGLYTGRLTFTQIEDCEKRQVIEDYYKKEHAIFVSKLD
jgi:hypothetical protein